MKTKIWFNRSFTSTYHFVDLIRNNPDGREFEIFGTHNNPYSVFLQGVDYAGTEEKLPDEQYIDFALEFCKKHKIKAVIPGYTTFMLFSSNLKAFNDIGVKVMVNPDTETLKILDDKSRLYNHLNDQDIVAIPEHYIVNTPEGFKAAYETLSSKGNLVCFKPVIAQGGQGFHIIDNSMDYFSTLMGPMTQRLSFDEAFRVISTRESFDSLMVSEFLDGTEYSLDCLGYGGELLACVPRKKIELRLRVLEENPALVEIARRITEKFKMPFVNNIQVRFKGDIPKLIEINPRMAGGLHFSCLSGINFPYLALRLLLEGKAEVPKPELNFEIGEIEKEFRFKRVV